MREEMEYLQELIKKTRPLTKKEIAKWSIQLLNRNLYGTESFYNSEFWITRFDAQIWSYIIAREKDEYCWIATFGIRVPKNCEDNQALETLCYYAPSHIRYGIFKDYDIRPINF